MTVEHARRAYGARASEYIDVLGSIAATDQRDQETIRTWAAGLSGRIIDVGCGPGHWTQWLHQQGFEVDGIDPVPEFVDRARRQHPEVAVEVGVAASLDAVDSSVAGILAWYSLIHLEPGAVALVLEEFARALCPGGGLCVGFFEGPELAPFDHAITTAYFWPIPRLVSVIEQAGFTVATTTSRTDPGRRPHAAIVAHRSTATR